MYAWMIDTDEVGDGSDAGTVGPSTITPLTEMVLRRGLPVSDGWEVLTFQLFDDDGEMYYTGRLLTDDEASFYAPLDDFGRPHAGATSIEYV